MTVILLHAGCPLCHLPNPILSLDLRVLSKVHSRLLANLLQFSYRLCVWLPVHVRFFLLPFCVIIDSILHPHKVIFNLEISFNFYQLLKLALTPWLLSILHRLDSTSSVCGLPFHITRCSDFPICGWFVFVPRKTHRFYKLELLSSKYSSYVYV